MILFVSLDIYAKDASLQKITLQLQWKHQFEFAGFYAAKEKGYYREAGLDVEFLEYNGQSNIDTVLNAKADYGLVYSSLIASYMKDKPLVFVANFFKQSPLVLVTQKNIKTPADLKGKRVMGTSKKIDDITLINMLNKFGLSLNDINYVQPTFKLQEFIHKKVDAISVFSTNELYTLNTKGIPYNLLDPTVYGAEYYDLNLFTTKQKVQNNPEQVHKFKEASIKGWQYALKHKSEIADLILSKYNTQHKSKDALMFEAKQIENLMLPTVYPIGSIDINRVKLIAENFRQAGFIHTRSFNFDGFIFDPITQKPIKKKKEEFINLSDEEIKYLQKKKEITLCTDPDWMPYEQISNGKHIGISADYIDHISSIINIPFTLVPTKTWNESLALFKDGQCDILSLVSPTPHRRSFMDFAQPYFDIPLAIATKNDAPFISDILNLKDKKIGLIKNYASQELLQKKYLDLNFVLVNTLSEGLIQVANGELYGIVDTLTTLSYQVQNYFPSELKIAWQFKKKIVLGIAIHKHEPKLLGILNKAINLVKDDNKLNTFRHETTVADHTYAEIKAFKKIAIPLLLLGLLLLISHYVLQKYNKKLKKQVNINIEALREKDEVLIQKQRMADMGEMLSMIAHQWRQPLGAINSTILGINIKIASGKYNLDHPADQEAFLLYLQNKLTNITDYVNHLSSTTDDFRNFYNPNKSKELVALTLPIENALHIVEDSLQRHGIEIIRDIRINPEFSMYSNEIMQVLLNLLKNSEDNFLEKHIDKPKIQISTFSRKKSYIISVCDNGGGIPEDIAKKIFDPYFSTKNDKHGTGLGLYMAKLIIEDHHYGTLNMVNRNDGVCFELVFKVPEKS